LGSLLTSGYYKGIVLAYIFLISFDIFLKCLVKSRDNCISNKTHHWQVGWLVTWRTVKLFLFFVRILQNDNNNNNSKNNKTTTTIFQDWNTKFRRTERIVWLHLIHLRTSWYFFLLMLSLTIRKGPEFR
jgi:hypothetical protein